MHYDKAFHAIGMPVFVVIISSGVIWILQLTAMEICLRKKWRKDELQKDADFSRSMRDFSQDFSQKFKD